MGTPLRTVLVGAGRMGLGFADDPVMALHYRYASHAQVLTSHPRLRWVAVVDPVEEVRASVHARWGTLVTARDLSELPADCQPELAVIATGPGRRREILDALPGLRAVLVEKPLAETLSEAESFVAECDRRRILLQVNLWRRADEQFRRMAAGGLHELIGPPQAVFGVYGNGLRNNGTHMVDFVRMLLGEVVDARVPAGARVTVGGPLPNDLSTPFSLRLARGGEVTFQPVDFRHFRENALDIWGERGRLSILQEGLRIVTFPRVPNRAMQGEREVSSDAPTILTSTVGDALFHMYSNLVDAVETGAPLWSPASSAIETTRLVDRVFAQARPVAEPGPKNRGGAT